MDRFNNESIENIDLYEFVLLNNMEKLMLNKKNKNLKLFNYYYYTLYKLIRNNIISLNRHIKNIVNIILDKFENEIEKSLIIENAVDFIEKFS